MLLSNPQPPFCGRFEVNNNKAFSFLNNWQILKARGKWLDIIELALQ